MCDVETFKNTIILIVYSYKRMGNTFFTENDDVTSMKFECHLRISDIIYGLRLTSYRFCVWTMENGSIHYTCQRRIF